MKKIRCFLAAIALIATLSGFTLQGMGSMANAATSWYASSPFAVGQMTSPVAVIHHPPCSAAWDC